MHLYKTSSRAKKKSAQKERTNAGTGRSANQRRGRNGGARSRFHHRVAGGEYRRQYTAHREAAPLAADVARGFHAGRSEEHTSELQSLMRISSAVFCLKKKN